MRTSCRLAVCSRWSRWQKLPGSTAWPIEHLTVPTDKGANPGLKVASLVAGMVAGADSIDDMALLRHGGMGRVFTRAYAPSTLGSFLRAFTFGHVRQLDAVAVPVPDRAGRRTGLLGPPTSPPPGRRGRRVRAARCRRHHHRGPRPRQAGRRVGYTEVRGLNAPLATLTVAGASPVIVGQRLRKGACRFTAGAKRLIGDAVKTARRLLGPKARVLARMDSAFYGRGAVHAALAGGAEVSVTVRMDPAGQGRDRCHRRRCLDPDRVHRRHLRPGHRALDLPGRGRRDRLHRVRRAEEVRAGPRTVGGAPDPGPQRRQEQGRRAGHPVRRLAVPRLLHHRRPRRCSTPCADKTHRGTRSSSKSTPTSRTRRSRTCPPACSPRTPPGWSRGDRVQPHPCRRHPHRRRTSPKRPPPPSAASSSTSPPGSRPPPVGSPCTFPPAWPWETAWTALFDRVCGPPRHAAS